MTNSSQNQQIRIPNLHFDKIVDDRGFASPTELTFRQTLLTGLQNYFGDEGVVVPTLSAAAITAIQNNQYPNPLDGTPVYTCGYGRIVYNSDANSIMISINNGSNMPLFKTVTLT